MPSKIAVEDPESCIVHRAPSNSESRSAQRGDSDHRSNLDGSSHELSAAIAVTPSAIARRFGAREAALLAVAVLVIAWMVLRWPVPEVMLNSHDWVHQLGGANQILHGEHPFIDWRTDYGPLRYYPSALAQRRFGPRTLAELLLTTAAYAIAYVLLFHLLWVASGRRLVAAALLVVALLLAPQLDKYYVVLGPVVCLWAAWRCIDRPTAAALMVLAAAVVVTGLFRADFGAFVGLAAVVAIATGPDGARERAGRLLCFATVAMLLVVPWLLWLTLHGGLAGYFVDTFLVAPQHASAMSRPFPRFAPPLQDPRNALFLLFVAVFLVPPLTFIVALRPGAVADPNERRRILTAVVLAQAVLVHASHRSDFSHLQQAMPVCFVLCAWLAGRAMAHRRAASRVGIGLVGLAGAALLCAAARMGQRPSSHVGTWLMMARLHALPRAAMVAELAARHPDDTWLQAIQYVRRCTATDDRIVALPPHIGAYYFADRRFAGGQPAWSPGFFSGPADQRRWIDTVRRQGVALVLGDAFHIVAGQPERLFANYSPLITEYVTTQFMPIGAFGRIGVRAPGVASLRNDGVPPCIRAAAGEESSGAPP